MAERGHWSGYPESDPGFGYYTPSAPPTIDPSGMAPIDEGELDRELFLELRRKMRELPRGTPERKRGIVEATDPETGERYVYDRYGDLIRQGFQPNRNRGRAFNVVKYVADVESGAIGRSQQGRVIDSAESERRTRDELAAWRFNEQQRADAVDRYNNWLYRQQQDEQGALADAATRAYREQMLGYQERDLEIRGESANRPQWSPAQEEYWREQAATERWQRTQPPKGSGGLAQMPTEDLLQRRDVLEPQLLDISRAKSQIGGLEEDTWWPEMGDPNVTEVPYGKLVYEVPFDQKDAALKWFGQMEARVRGEYDSINRILAERGMPNAGLPPPPGAGGAGGAPWLGGGLGKVAGKALDWLDSGEPQTGGPGRIDPTNPGDTPSPIGSTRDVDAPAAQSHAPDDLMRQSWSDVSEKRLVSIPPPETWESLQPHQAAFYAILEDLKAQGYNVDAVVVQQWAAAQAKKLMIESSERLGEDASGAGLDFP